MSGGFSGAWALQANLRHTCEILGPSCLGALPLLAQPECWHSCADCLSAVLSSGAWPSLVATAPGAEHARPAACGWHLVSCCGASDLVEASKLLSGGCLGIAQPEHWGGEAVCPPSAASMRFLRVCRACRTVIASVTPSAPSTGSRALQLTNTADG